MTLTDILPFVRQLRTLDKLRRIRIIAEQLDTDENISPLEPGKIYDMPTPYHTYGVAEILMNKLEITDTNSNTFGNSDTLSAIRRKMNDGSLQNLVVGSEISILHLTEERLGCSWLGIVLVPVALEVLKPLATALRHGGLLYGILLQYLGCCVLYSLWLLVLWLIGIYFTFLNGRCSN